MGHISQWPINHPEWCNFSKIALALIDGSDTNFTQPFRIDKSNCSHHTPTQKIAQYGFMHRAQHADPNTDKAT